MTEAVMLNDCESPETDAIVFRLVSLKTESLPHTSVVFFDPASLRFCLIPATSNARQMTPQTDPC